MQRNAGIGVLKTMTALKFLILVFCLTTVYGTAHPLIDMNTVRKEYIEAIESTAKTDELLKKLSTVSQNDPLLIAYKGATEALKAKHAFNPYTKLNYLKKSQQTLEKAIQLRPTDIEIRFLRFSIQHYLPSFLRADKELQDDKAVIIEHITDTGLDQGLRQSVGKFMIESGRCTPQEVKRVQTVLNK